MLYPLSYGRKRGQAMARVAVSLPQPPRARQPSARLDTHPPAVLSYLCWQSRMVTANSLERRPPETVGVEHGERAEDAH